MLSLRRAVKFTTMAAMLLGCFHASFMRLQLNAALVLVLFAVMTLLGLTLLWPFASDLSFRSAAHRRSTTYVLCWHSCTRTVGVSEVQAVESSRLARSVGVHP